jgi:hypothetical protein
MATMPSSPAASHTNAEVTLAVFITTIPVIQPGHLVDEQCEKQSTCEASIPTDGGRQTHTIALGEHRYLHGTAGSLSSRTGFSPNIA